MQDKNKSHLTDTIDELEVNLHTSELNLSAVSSALRHTEAQSIVKNNIIMSMTSGLVPVPLFDIISLTNIEFHLIQTLAEHYELPPEGLSRSLVTSLVSGVLPVAGLLGLGSVMKSIPGIGTLAGSGTVSVVSGAVTYAVGQVFIRHFEQGGTIEDFNPSEVGKYFQEQYTIGKQVAKEMVNEIKAARAAGKNAPDQTPAEEPPEKGQ